MMLTHLQKNTRGIFLVLSALLGLALGTFCAALLGYLLQSPPSTTTADAARTARPKTTVSLQDYQNILGRDIFNSAGGKLSFAPETDRSAAAAPVAVVSDWELIGTVSGGASPLATLRNEDETRAYAQGSELPDGSTLTLVERSRATITLPDGREQQLVLTDESGSGGAAAAAPGLGSAKSRARASRRKPPTTATTAATTTGVRALGENRWLITSAEADNARDNIGELLKQARIEPNLVDGQTSGFMVKMIQPGTLISQLGLQVGDVLHEINDVSLDSPEKALQVFQQLRQARQVNIALERSGTPMTFSYEID
jgi:general secretion pathway protein C